METTSDNFDYNGSSNVDGHFWQYDQAEPLSDLLARSATVLTTVP